MKGKLVLITGGTRGIGKITAEWLAREGAAVCVTSRHASPDLPAAPLQTGTISTAKLDVTDEDSIFRLFAWLEEQHGQLDVLVNNAGIGIFKPLADTTREEWEAVIATNLTGLFLCSREAYRLMKRKGGGRIINLSSITGYMPIPHNGAYGSSKHAVRGLSQICNEEWKEDRVFVTTVSAGAVATEITDDRMFDPADMLKPEEIAEAILHIASKPLTMRVDEIRILPPKGVL
ncbi:SDR family oxidoreductase [Brevibacillus migulae]|uniref:SDR family oxidoreductase n=1 Tax=Brevibacillus migulae TaxID=1644114 RepID=UPI001F423740|nr:SDR family oxidoreductase [Brevibacillus migulae]